VTGSGREVDERRAQPGSWRYRATAYRATTGEQVVPPHPSHVDLHTHSSRSDGVLEPEALVDAAAAAGIAVLALSDHDTLAGVRELCAVGHDPLPLQLVPAVEINSVAAGIDSLWEGELHILGLGVDPDDGQFETALERQRSSRVTRFRRIVERLSRLGFAIDRQVNEYLAAAGAAPGASLGRPQIARCLVAAGHAASVDDAMRRLLARGRPAYVARDGLGPREAISAIRAAGGLPSLAHFADAARRHDLVSELKDAGLAGLEVHYRHFDAATVADLGQLARAMGLVQTGGSDYHGDEESYAQAHSSLYVPDEDATTLLEYLARPTAGSGSAAS
jgi:predicted metal-dependent phosphoesterase TrpH